MHRRGREGVAHAGIALHVEPRRAERALAAEADALNPQLGDDVVVLAVLRRPVHREPGDRDRRDVHYARADDAVPTDAAVLREIVVDGSEAGQVLRHKSVLPAERIAREQAVAARERVVKTDRALVGDVTFV